MDEVKKLYTALLGKGYTTNDLGDEGTFREKMKDKENRKTLYDWVSRKGNFRLGAYEEYEKRLSPSVEPAPAPVIDNVHYADRINAEPTDMQQMADAQRAQWGEAQRRADERQAAGDVPDYNFMRVERPKLIDAPELDAPKFPSQFDADKAVDESMQRINGAVAPEYNAYEDARMRALQRQAQTNYEAQVKQNAEEAVGDLRGRAAALSDKYEAKDEDLRRDITFAPNTTGGILMQQGWHRGYNQDLISASAIIWDTEKMIADYAARQNLGGPANLVRSFATTAFDPMSYDLGLTDLTVASRLENAVDKLDNGETLTDTEQLLLDAAVNQQVLKTFYGELSGWQLAGKTTGDMIPFAMQIASNPASSIYKYAGSKVAEKVAAHIVKRVSKKVLQNILTKAATAAVNTAGVAASGYGVALTSNIMDTAADVTQRRIGDIGVDYDENGIARYDGRHNIKEAGEALIEGINNKAFEFASEALGAYFAPFLKGLGKVAGKGLSKMGMGAVNRWIGDIAKKGSVKAIGEFFDKTQFHGFAAEYGEEIANGMLNAAFVGDMTMEDVFSKDNLIDTAIGLSVMGVLGGAIGTGGYIAAKRHEKAELNKAGVEGQRLLRSKWRDFAGAVERSEDTRSLTDNLRKVMEAYGLRTLPAEDMRAVYDYAVAYNRYKALDAVSAKAVQDGVMDAEEIELRDLYNSGRGSLDKAAVRQEYEAAREALAVALMMPDVLVEQHFRDYGDAMRTADIYEDNGDTAAADALRAYVRAKAKHDGMTEYIRDEYGAAVAKADAEIDAVTNKKDGNLYEVSLQDGSNAYIVDGAVVVDEQGFIDEAKSDELLHVDIGGTVKQVTPDKVAKINNVTSAYEAKEARMLDIETAYNNAYDALTGVPTPESVAAPAVDNAAVPAATAAPAVQVDPVEAAARALNVSVEELSQAIPDAQKGEGVAAAMEANGNVDGANAVRAYVDAVFGNNTPAAENTTDNAATEPALSPAQQKKAARDEVAKRIPTKGKTKLWTEAAPEDVAEYISLLSDDAAVQMQTVDKYIDAVKAKQEKVDPIEALELNDEIAFWEGVKGILAERNGAAAAVTENEMQPVEVAQPTNADVAVPVEQSVRLSDEVDENGKQFVLNSNGEIAFGEITDETGLTPAPILLSEGMITNPATNDGYGLVHIEARHGEQIRKAGYKSVVEFVEEVAKNYEVIREGKDRDGHQTYMLQLTDKHNNTLMVELSGDGTYWNINTAGIFKTSYGKNRKEVYSRHTTAKQSTETAEASQDAEQGGTQATSSINAPTTSSASEDTAPTADVQEISQESGENAENGGERMYSQEELAETKEQLGELNATSAPEFAARLFSIKPWKTLEEANVALKELLASYGETLNGQSLAVMPFLDKAQGLIREYNKSQEPRSVEEVLENGDKRITNYNSLGEVATVATERDGKVVSVDSYDEGVLFEHTEYDENGKAASVTRYDKQGNAIGTQVYVDGKAVPSEERAGVPPRPSDYSDAISRGNAEGTSAPGQNAAPKTEQETFPMTEKEFADRRSAEIIKENEAVDEVEAYNRALDEYPAYINALIRSGKLKDIYKRASVGERIALNKIIQSAGYEISEVNTEEVKNEAKKSESRYSVGDVVSARFGDGSIITGTIENIENGKIKVRANNGRIYPVDESRITKVNKKPKAINTVESFTQAVADKAEENRRRPLRARAQEWQEKLGVQVNVIESVDEVKNSAALEAINGGAKVTGWFSGGKVYVYMPGIEDMAELDRTVVHEVVAHKGLKSLMGDKFDALCDKVWESMDKEARAKYLGYVDARDINAPSVAEMRAAADEYMAFLAEGVDLTDADRTVWQKIVEFFREFVEKLGVKMSDKDIELLIKASYANLRNTAAANNAQTEGGETRERKVFHGSGAKFDKFDHSFMGTGEGAQAFGWGTYVTEVDGIGRQYATIMRDKAISDKHRENAIINNLARQVLASNNGDKNAALEELRNQLNESWSDKKRVKAEIKIIETGKFLPESKVKANLYTVEIPDDNGSNYLHWEDVVPDEVIDNLWDKLRNTYGEDVALNVSPKYGQDGEHLYKKLSRGIGGDKQASLFLSDMGFVGISYPANATTGGRADGARNYVIFNEDDAVIEDRTMFRRANRSQEVFVSNARKAVEEIKQEKATPQQWLAMLKKNGGLKAGEDAWMELSEWLENSEAKSLTKQELIDFIDENAIKIEEVEYEDLGKSIDYELAAVEGNLERARRDLAYEEAQVPIAEKWLQDSQEEYDSFLSTANRLKTEYGENSPEYRNYIFYDSYTDVLAGAKRALENAKSDVEYRRQQIAELEKAVKEKQNQKTRGINRTRLDYTTVGLENKREIALVVPTIEPYNESDEVHFGDAGGGRAVAWVRFGETTDSEGKRVLVIDEIQSKRHQDGREKGYATEDYIYAKRELDYLYKKMYEKGLTGEEHERYKWLQQYTADNFGIVPAAPFEKNWHELAMKRMLRLAAEEGFDKVAWTTGEQQAQRYNLSKQVGSIEVRRDNGEYNVFTYDTRGALIYPATATMTPQQITETFGKELGGKIIAVESGKRETITGVDLDFGGEGMKGFYDRMLPSFVQKYTKKWGAKVGKVTMPNLGENNTMWSVDVTPEMQESVMEGQTMFRMGSRVDARMAEVAAHFDGKELTAEQQAVVDVFGGNADNLTISVKTQDGNERKIVMRQGNETGAGAKHSLYRHYGTGVGVITSDDIISIPDVVANGVRTEKQRGNTRLAEYKLTDANGNEFTVLTEIKKGKEIFNDFYSNKKAPLSGTFNTQSAHTANNNALSADKGSDNSSNSQVNDDIRLRKMKYDRYGNPIGDGSWSVDYKVDEVVLSYPNVSYKVNKSKTTESVYVTYYNNDSKYDYLERPTVTVRFGDHDSNAVIFGDQLRGFLFDESTPQGKRNAEKERNILLARLGLKKAVPVYGKFIITRQVSNRDLERNIYEVADKTMPELYDLPVGADISQYKGKLAKNSRYLILGDEVLRGEIKDYTYEDIPEVEQQRAKQLVRELIQPYAKRTENKEHNTEEQTMFSFRRASSDIADEYMAAVENGDRETAQRLEKEVAAQAERVDSEIVSAVNAAAAGLNTPVEIVSDIQDVPDARRRGSKGWYENGKVYLVLPNAEGVEDAVETVLHEVVGHKGLRRLFGEKFDDMLADVFKSVPKRVRAEIMRRALDLMRRGRENFLHEATEEYLAEQAERGFEDYTVWDTVKGWFNNLLRSIGVRHDISDEEIRYMLWRSYKLMKSGKSFINEVENINKQEEFGVGEYRMRIKMPLRSEGREVTAADGVVELREAYDATIESSLYQAREALQDSMRSLKVFQNFIEKATGKEIPDWMNAYYLENAMSSANKAEADLFARVYYQRIIQALTKLNKEGLAYEEIYDYMMAKHGIERNREMAVREALTDKKGLNRGAYEDWTRRKKEIWAKKLGWEDEQKELDNLARMYGAKEKDYSGLTGMYGLDYRAKAYGAVKAVEGKRGVGELWKAINDATAAILKKQYDTNMMSLGVKSEIEGMYKYYIPLRGFDEKTAGEVYAYLNNSRSPMAKNVKAEGRTSKAENPIAWIAAMAESAIVRGNRNRMKNAFFNLVAMNPNDLVSIDSNVYLEYKNGAWKVATPDIPANATQEQVQQIMERFEQEMEDKCTNFPDLFKRLKDNPDIPYVVTETHEVMEHQIYVRRNGKLFVMTVNGNPRLAQAVNGYTNPDSELKGAIPVIVEGGKVINRWLSSVYTTRNPDFVVSNFIRDMFYSNTMVWVKESPEYARKFNANYAVSVARILGLIWKYDQGKLNMEIPIEKMFYDFMINGGETGYTNLKQMDKRKKKLLKDLAKKGRKSAVEYVGMYFDEINRSVENAARFAAFMTSREMGRTMARSIWDAKEISVNFNKKGAGDKMFGATGQTGLGNIAAIVAGLGVANYTFWNAGVQGLNNFATAVAKNPYKGSALIAVLTAMGAAAALFNYYDDDEEEDSYWMLPSYIRRNNFVFRVTGMKDWITLPLPVEYRAIYGMSNYLTGVIIGKEEFDALEFAGLLSQVLPLDMLADGGGLNALVPTWAKPLWQNYTNTNWMGTPIAKKSDFNTLDPEYKRVYNNVSAASVELSKFLHVLGGGDTQTRAENDLLFEWNPAMLENLASGYLGGYASMTEKAMKTVEWLAGAREYDNSYMLLLNRVLKSSNVNNAARSVKDKYYENLGEIERWEHSMNGWKRDMVDPAKSEEERNEAQAEYEKMMRSDDASTYYELKAVRKAVDLFRDLNKVHGDGAFKSEELEMMREYNRIFRQSRK